MIAPIEDRIVQRAILDVLQDASELPGVQQVLATPTSIGGIRGRGVEHAIAVIQEKHEAGEARFLAGSDISGFFTQIRQSTIVEFVQSQTTDARFLDLFTRALKVDLADADNIDPADRKLFPTDDVGVAQGCPLSALAGNIALREFDAQMNRQGITCVRYIDDFILLGRRKESVEKAFDQADVALKKLGMDIYRPNDGSNKAFFGKMGDDIEFLGYQIVPGIYPPCNKNRDALILAVKSELHEGRSQILRALKGEDPLVRGRPAQLFCQTLTAIDGLVRAWSGSFRATRCLSTARDIDNTCDQLVSDFIKFYTVRTKAISRTDKRRVLGVHVVTDEIRRRLASNR